MCGRESQKTFQPFTKGERIYKCIYSLICLRGFLYALILFLVWPYLVLRCKSKHAKGRIHPNKAIQACQGPVACICSAGQTVETGNHIQASSERNFRTWLERGWSVGCWAPLCPRGVPALQPAAASLSQFWLKVEGWTTIAVHATRCLVLSVPHSDLARVFHLRICVPVVCSAQDFGKMRTKWILYF